MRCQLIDDHLYKDWFKQAQANAEKDGKIYTHGIAVIQQDMKKFYADGLHKVAPYSQYYIPNPYRFQYDLFIHLWINYYSILDREIAYQREHNSSKAEELEYTQTLYGISREDCLFAAAEIRWPTTIDPNGARSGKFVRDPWTEKRVNGISDKVIKYAASFGGGGQGKTTTFTAFDIMMWDHYIFTEKGARCMISTVREDKLNAVAWPYIQNLYKNSKPGISLYSGKGELRAGWTIMRPGNKDTAGVFKGILLGNNLDDQAIVDKLTGTHGHWFVGYTLDEAQSTRHAPLDASLNFTLHAKDYRIKLAGNYGEDNDTLGKNTEPIGGWDTKDENSERWETVTKTGQQIIVLHFNNDNSPGMTEAGARIFPYLPNTEKKRRLYPNERSRSLSNTAYRRFWMGWRVAAATKRVVWTQDLIEANLAHLPLDLKEVQSTFFAFDSAPADIDRNPLLIAQSGIDRATNQLVFGPKYYKMLPKATTSNEYYRQSTASILKVAKEEGCKSGDGIVDWTGRPAHFEFLDLAKFDVERIVYNMAVADGVRKNTFTGRVDHRIPIDISLDWKAVPNGQQLYAHMVAECSIDFAAWLLMVYVQAKRIRGINKQLLDGVSVYGLEKEFFSQKYFLKPSVKFGERFKLGDGRLGVKRKEDFRDEYGFSPDLFDTLLQMAWFAFFRLNIPLTPIDSDVTLSSDVQKPKTIFDHIDEINNNFTFSLEPLEMEIEDHDMEVSFYGREDRNPFD